VLNVEHAAAERVTWYNNDRLHSSLGIIPPVEHENTHYAALNSTKPVLRRPIESGQIWSKCITQLSLDAMCAAFLQRAADSRGPSRPARRSGRSNAPRSSGRVCHALTSSAPDRGAITRHSCQFAGPASIGGAEATMGNREIGIDPRIAEQVRFTITTLVRDSVLSGFPMQLMPRLVEQ
jgi:hypothetical protein